MKGIFWWCVVLGGQWCASRHLFREYESHFLGEDSAGEGRSYLFSHKHGRTSIMSEAIEEDLRMERQEEESRTEAAGPVPFNPLIIAAEGRESEYCYGKGLSILRDRYGQYKPAYKTSSVFKGRTCYEKEFRGFKQIGRGAYGRVWRAEHRATGIKVAIKELMRSNDLRLIRREECIQHSLNSDLIARHFCTISERGGIAFVMELIDGHTLYEARDLGPLPAQEIAAQLILTLEYLHSKHILYRDLKPENVMYIPETAQTKLIDFGLSVELVPPYWNTKGIAGTPEFMAPEVVHRGSYYSFPADWYSMGLVIYELIAGKNPFDGIKPVEVQYQRIQQGFPCRLQDRSACHLIKALTDLDPAKRWGSRSETLKQIKRHPWFIGVRWRNYDRRMRSGSRPDSRTAEMMSTSLGYRENEEDQRGTNASNTYSTGTRMDNTVDSLGATETSSYESLRRATRQGKPRDRKGKQQQSSAGGKGRLQTHKQVLQIIESEDESDLSSIPTKVTTVDDEDYRYDPIFRADPQYVLFQPEFQFPTPAAAAFVDLTVAKPNEDYISDNIAEGKAPVFRPCEKAAALLVNVHKHAKKKAAKRL